MDLDVFERDEDEDDDDAFNEADSYKVEAECTSGYFVGYSDN